jgi:maleylpyruvate isomerase
VTALSGARHDVDLTRQWMREGTSVVLGAIESLSDDAFDAGSALPSWTRRHVVAHLARNAEALGRLLHWARTGAVTPMYADAGQRAADIESSALASPATLRADVVSTARAFAAAAADLPFSKWSAIVRSATGRDIPAAEVPWLRAREVWLHAIDLDAGLTADDLPPEFAAALVDDVVGALSSRPGVSGADLVAGERRWRLGCGGPTVDGDVRQLAAWLTGRSSGKNLAADHLPELPAWL